MFRDSPQIKTEHASRTAYTDPSFNFIERLIFVAVLGGKKKKKCDSASVTVGNGQWQTSGLFAQIGISRVHADVWVNRKKNCHIFAFVFLASRAGFSCSGSSHFNTVASQTEAISRRIWVWLLACSDWILPSSSLKEWNVKSVTFRQRSLKFYTMLCVLLRGSRTILSSARGPGGEEGNCQSFTLPLK